MSFKKVVEKTRHLETAFREGLQALRAEDRPHIDAEDTRRLRGSADVDSATQDSDPCGNRWDFAIAYQHTNRNEEVVYWVETHTGSTSEVSVVIKKAAWLQRWFKADGKLLAEFEKDIVWVSSGATTFTLTSPQRKQMAVLGFRSVGSKLQIRNKR